MPAKHFFALIKDRICPDEYGRKHISVYVFPLHELIVSVINVLISFGIIICFFKFMFMEEILSAIFVYIPRNFSFFIF